MYSELRSTCCFPSRCPRKDAEGFRPPHTRELSQSDSHARCKKGYIRKEHNTYIPVSKTLQELKVEATRKRIVEQHEATTRNLVEFCKAKYNIAWTQDEAEGALLTYLKAHDLDILLAATEGTPIPSIARAVPNAKFLVNAFARHVHENNAEVFAYLRTIVEGHLLANALVFPDVSAVTRKFRRTKVFLDTRVILNALGYNGAAYQAPAKDMLEILYEEGVQLWCFRHTFDEVCGILNALARSFHRKDAADASHTIARVFHARGHSESDVLLAIATLEKDLARLRIKVEERPPYVAEYQIDESELDGLLQDTIHYVSDQARVRDVESLSAIYRLRKGGQYPIIEECHALFVTTNALVVRVSGKFFNSYQSADSAPVCISDHHLTTILWLKKPMAVPDLPFKQIIADSYAAVEPSEEMWRKFLVELAKLQERGDITAEEYFLFRSAIEARSLLMEATLGNPEVFVEGTVPEIVEKCRESIKAEAEARRQEAEKQTQKLQRKLETIDLQIERFADLVAIGVSKILFVVFLVLLVIGAYSTFSSRGPNWLTYPLAIAQGILLVLSVANLAKGVTVKRILRRLERVLRKFLTMRVKNVFGVSSSAEMTDQGDS